MCSKPKKTKNVKNLKITSSSSGNIYTITMTAKKGSTTGILKKVDVELATQTTTEQPGKFTLQTFWDNNPFLSVSSKECELGYSAVCTNNLVENHDEADMRAVCPATHSANGKEDEEEGMWYLQIYLELMCFKSLFLFAHKSCWARCSWRNKSSRQSTQGVCEGPC